MNFDISNNMLLTLPMREEDEESIRGVAYLDFSDVKRIIEKYNLPVEDEMFRKFERAYERIPGGDSGIYLSHGESESRLQAVVGPADFIGGCINYSLLKEFQNKLGGTFEVHLNDDIKKYMIEHGISV